MVFPGTLSGLVLAVGVRVVLGVVFRVIVCITVRMTETSETAFSVILIFTNSEVETLSTVVWAFARAVVCVGVGVSLGLRVSLGVTRRGVIVGVAFRTTVTNTAISDILVAAEFKANTLSTGKWAVAWAVVCVRVGVSVGLSVVRGGVIVRVITAIFVVSTDTAISDILVAAEFKADTLSTGRWAVVVVVL